jgi:hypothetical protein
MHCYIMSQEELIHLTNVLLFISLVQTEKGDTTGESLLQTVCNKEGKNLFKMWTFKA